MDPNIMKKTLILLLVPGMLADCFAQCTTTIVSSTTIITYPVTQPTSSSSGYFWVCNHGSVSINGNANTIYVEAQGSAIVSGAGNTVYLRGGTVTFQGTQPNYVIHTPGSTINNMPAGGGVTECPALTLHYTGPGGCINTSINEASAPLRLDVTLDPLNERLNILADDMTRILLVRIMDLNGRLVIEEKGRSNMVLDVKALGTGIYTCTVVTDRGTITRKVLKE
jgi:hypothetical protein